MNTPAHLALSTFLWRKESSWRAASAVAIGAILPDVPMFGFYAYQKWIAQSTEREIWSILYFDENWQLFFDLFNSIPLFLLVVGISYACKNRWGILLGASALLHICCDLPLHNDDAHRHFLPLMQWRFISPVSYWDPRHHGLIFMWIELCTAIAALVVVCLNGRHKPMRLLAGTTLMLYLLGIVFVLIVWIPELITME